MTSLARLGHLGSPCVRRFCGAPGRKYGRKWDQKWFWDGLTWLQFVTKPVAVPLTLLGIGTSAAAIYQRCNPEHYAECYLRWVAAGKFEEPQYVGLWVENAALTEIVKTALTQKKRRERITLISGLQMSGKTSGVMMECSRSQKRGFYVNFGSYQNDSDGDLKAYLNKNLLANSKVNRSLFQKAIWLCFPVPALAHVTRGILGAFQKGGLVLIIDEAQVLANKNCLANGIMNDFCALSGYGPVVLLASEYSVPEYLKMMTHVNSRTKQVYAPTATKEEMLPHIRDRFGEEAAEKILHTFDGAFGLLECMEKAADMDAQLTKALAKHRSDIVRALGLHKNGMESPLHAHRTALAMCTAAELAFGNSPIDPFDSGTLELAQAGVAKIEGSDVGTVQATWTSPSTEGVVKELLCDSAVRTVMTKRFAKADMDQLEAAIHLKCVR